MASRPDHLELGNNRRGASSPSQGDLPSPRSGEIPPALSPLDAFALQGRLLAQQLEASRDNGRRLSRLPPLTIANELAKPRPGYYNTPSSAGSRIAGEQSPTSASSANTPGTNPDVSKPSERPVSRYPFIQTFDDAESIAPRDSIATIKQVPNIQEEDEEELSPRTTTTANALPRVDETEADTVQPAPEQQQPEPSARFPVVKEERIDSAPGTSANDDPATELSSNATSQTPSQEPPRPINPNPINLAVPGSPAGPHFPSFLRNELGMRIARSDNGEDSDSLSIPGDPHDPRHSERKLSNSSAFSRPRSPYSPLFAPPPRSPSTSSERSFHPRASVNFSRPLSRAGKVEPRPSFEGSIRNQRSDSPTHRPSVDVLSLNESVYDSPHLPPTPWLESTTPLSLTDDEHPPTATNPNGAPSYIYAKYSLPRGRVMSRTSAFMEDFSTHKFEWEQPLLAGSNVKPIKGGQKPSQNAESDAQKLNNRASRLVMASIPAYSAPSRTHSADDTTPAGLSVNQHKHHPSHPPRSPSSLSLQPKSASDMDNANSSIQNSPKTQSLKSRSSFTQARMPDPNQIADSLQQLTPEGHLAKGIECHEGGELQKSTYHLRLAARGGNATAMLLYALACRHGWGMRANQEEGVSWLRKAVESTGLEVADDEDDVKNSAEGPGSDGRANDVVAKREHKAQLALSIYELGVSYMNGWGISQDKTLAVRCFEIAGNWGDGDALAEAGFCYAKGVGCKKDLRRAADFYRRAEKRGVGMAGNSWIYKDKYMQPPAGAKEDDRKARGADKEKEKKPRDKSRTRTMFGGWRKQSAAA